VGDSSPLWVNESNFQKNSALKEKGLRDLVKLIAKRAHIEKRIWPYLFRHSRNTELAPEVSASVLDEYAGWVQGSAMPAFYVHLSGKNVDDAILKSAGLIKKDADKRLPKSSMTSLSFEVT
jgi:integrase